MRHLALACLAVGSLGFLVGCSSDDGGDDGSSSGGASGSGTGGSSGTAGTNSVGGSGTGGSGTGGSATGGSGSGTGGSGTGGSGTGGSGTGGSGTGGSGTGGSSGGGNSGAGGSSGGPGGDFSFFVTSFEAMQELSDSEYGFGGDLGGLDGADALCQTIAESVGAGDKTWRAFLSVTDDGNGSAVDARDRIGSGPWVDANGREIAGGVEELFAGDRPAGDAASDLPDELGRSLEATGGGHDILTGSDKQGRLQSTDADSTCNDWTSASNSVGYLGDYQQGTVHAGHAWPSPANAHWADAHTVSSCLPGYLNNEVQQTPTGDPNCVGCLGGYGGIYCFALSE